MQDTHYSFIGLLCRGDGDAWCEFEAASRPLLRHWLGRTGLSEEDVDDLTQEVLLFVSAHLHEFEHNTRTGAFRKWLRSITVNMARNHLRKQQRQTHGRAELRQLLEQLDDARSPMSIAFERDYQHALLRQLLHRVSTEFSAQTIRIFQQHVLQEASAAETAAQHGVSKAAVYVAKSKVMRRLRETLGEVEPS